MEQTIALIGGLRQFRVAKDALSAGAVGAASGTPVPAPAPAPVPAPAMALFGECFVYVPAHEWEAVNRARRSSKQIVVTSAAESLVEAGDVCG